MTVRDHQLRFTDTLRREKVPFEALTPGHVGIYVCGPTVYGDAHLGHAKSYVSFDVIVKYLRWLGFKVRYVQNITDVGHLTDDADEGEDKIQKKARLDRVHPLELAERYTASYLRDMDALKVARADIYPRATQHIIEQIEIIEKLIASGHAYEVGGNVYFSVASFPDYGMLSGRQTEEGESGHRVEVRGDKRDPRDFALWKRAEGGHVLKWRSPWGEGYPGWHIECSAMSTKYLGSEFDIHGGGLENQFPHHECEIAQSRAAGDRFARYWLHNNMITRDGQKMGKSLGNAISVAEVLEQHSAEAVRTFLLTTHYRAPANYTDEGLAAAQAGVDRLAEGRRRLAKALEEAAEDASDADAALNGATREALGAFQAAMDDDVNTPIAISALFDFVRRTNGLLTEGRPSKEAVGAALSLIDELAGDLLGLLPVRAGREGQDAAPFVDLLVTVRRELKAARAFELADFVRDSLSALGVEVRDTKEGADWSFKDA